MTTQPDLFPDKHPSPQHPPNPFARGDVSDDAWRKYVARYYAERLRGGCAEEESEEDEQNNNE